jgi:hypothetical protein
MPALTPIAEIRFTIITTLGKNCAIKQHDYFYPLSKPGEKENLTNLPLLGQERKEVHRRRLATPQPGGQIAKWSLVSHL